MLLYCSSIFKFIFPHNPIISVKNKNKKTKPSDDTTFQKRKLSATIPKLTPLRSRTLDRASRIIRSDNSSSANVIRSNRFKTFRNAYIAIANLHNKIKPVFEHH